MYADDVKLYLHTNSLDDSIFFQYDLYSLVNWGSANGMSLDLKKCKKLHCLDPNQYLLTTLSAHTN